MGLQTVATSGDGDTPLCGQFGLLHGNVVVRELSFALDEPHTSWSDGRTKRRNLILTPAMVTGVVVLAGHY